MSRAAVLHRVRTKPGDTLDVEVLRGDVGRVYDMDSFERVEFTVAEREGKVGLLILAVEKPWGPDHLHVVWRVSRGPQGDGRFSAHLNHLRTSVNRLGAEWKNEIRAGTTFGFLSELYQPVDYSGSWFVVPRVEFDEALVRAYAGDHAKLGRYTLSTYRATAEIGRQFGKWGEIRAGIERSVTTARTQFHSIAVPAGSNDRGALTLSATYDQLDGVRFPQSGQYVRGEALFARSEMGADSAYGTLAVRAANAATFGGISYLASVSAAAPVSGHVPTYYLHAVGGFLDPSGYEAGQLRGQFAAAIRLAAYRPTDVFGSSVYVGCSAEAGHAWDSMSSVSFGDVRVGGSLFFGADTAFGAIGLAYGAGRSIDSATCRAWHHGFYLALGPTFGM